jgi:hypothetical protein
MRRWQSLILAITLATTAIAPAQAARPKGRPPGWNPTPIEKKGFRFNRQRPSSEVTYKVVRNCTTWTITKTVSGPNDADGKPTTITVTEKWRKCPGYNAGTGTGQPFRVADSTPEGNEIAEVFAPVPQLKFDARTPQPLAYTQRPMYWWLDPATQTTVTAPVEVVEGGTRTGRVIGSALLRPVKLIFDPGIAGSGAQECVGADVTRAYDESQTHVDQTTTCWHIYYVSSRKLPQQRYWAFARVEWEVLNVTIEGRAQDGPFENRESVTPLLPIEVREIQTVTTCRGSKGDCPFK